jgi:hypothetical protein
MHEGNEKGYHHMSTEKQTDFDPPQTMKGRVAFTTGESHGIGAAAEGEESI